MTQTSFLNDAPWTITELTHYLRGILESDPNLTNLWANGEISNISYPRSGHMYFTLKDETCSIRCVMWRPNVKKLFSLPNEGDAIKVRGSISVYEASGQYQLYVDTIRKIGEGDLYQTYMERLNKLENEGLFDQDRKLELPQLPQIIGIITSPTGAAVQDILNTIRRRYTLAEVIIAPTTVQGVEAPDLIVTALKSMILNVKPDVIIISRGGGSIEDLWAFNDEHVARAIAESPIPIISGIGHETDFTISDFVSDLRAPTPTAAAELATPDKTELIGNLSDISQHLDQIMLLNISEKRFTITESIHKLQLLSPGMWLQTFKQKIDELIYRSDNSLMYRLKLLKTQFSGLNKNLDSLNPMSALRRGYSIVSLEEDGTVINKLSQIEIKDQIIVHVSDGSFGAEVKNKSGNND